MHACALAIDNVLYMYCILLMSVNEAYLYDTKTGERLCVMSGYCIL